MKLERKKKKKKGETRHWTIGQYIGLDDLAGHFQPCDSMILLGKDFQISGKNL